MHFLKKIPLFCSSYSLLFVIAILLKVNFKNISINQLFLIVLIFILIIFGYYFLFKCVKNTSPGNSHTICSVENKNDMMHTYLLPYLVFILSFVAPSPLKNTEFLALFIFFLILFFVYIRSDLFLFDFVLILCGYSYYKVTSKTNEFIVISDVNLYEKINEDLFFRLIDDNIFKYGE